MNHPPCRVARNEARSSTLNGDFSAGLLAPLGYVGAEGLLADDADPVNEWLVSSRTSTQASFDTRHQPGMRVDICRMERVASFEKSSREWTVPTVSKTTRSPSCHSWL
jgi:hypothetical protein